MIKRFDLYLNTAELGVMHIADVALQEEHGVISTVGFRYTANYLAQPQAFAIDPVQLPLSVKESTLTCKQAAPAFIDDYLPDAWGRKVLTKLAMQRYQQRLNANCISEMLSFSQQVHSRIGALCFVEQGQTPHYAAGIALEQLHDAEQTAQNIDQQDFAHLDMNAMGLVYLANSGSGVGGARPKALVHDQGTAYLAKFNRSTDPYNNARVEFACLLMAQGAGINIGHGKIISDINQRDVLLLERFDTLGNARRHLITANGLLKHPSSQQDPGHSFRYDDLHRLLQRHSYNIEDDLQQLLRLMLFNRAINNTDDHERNFSFMHSAKGYQLAPAYDLVPSMATGEYHAAGFAYQPYPPTVSEAEKMGRIFGLPKDAVSAAAQQVREAVEQWSSYAEQAGVDEEQMQRVGKVFQV